MLNTNLWYLIALFTLIGCGNSEDNNPWKLVWYDEFTGTEVDTTKWSFDIGTGAPLLQGWGNNELQYYTSRPENVYVQDGMLHIVALEESYNRMPYTSAKLKTAGKATWTYGRFAVRAKVPGTQGMWPAIWMMPEEPTYGSWPRSGEIDIMELLGHEPHILHGTLHFGESYNDKSIVSGTVTLSEGAFTDNFHEYAVEWEPGEIRWYLDGVQYSSATPEDVEPYIWPFDQPFHMILNLAVGGNWPGNPDETTVLPQAMLVDYVRIYQR